MRRIGCGVQDVGLEKRKEQGPRAKVPLRCQAVFASWNPLAKLLASPTYPNRFWHDDEMERQRNGIMVPPCPVEP